MLIIGSHVSFNKETQLLGSLKEALGYGENTFMFYTGAPQNTNRCSINDGLTLEALTLMKSNNIDYSKVIVHAPYIINLANRKEEDKFNFSIRFLTEEVERCDKLGIKYMVLHPGSHVGCGIDTGIENIINGVNNKNRIGVCMDTCHLNDAGYDVADFDLLLDEFDKEVGLSYLKCIHINDSKNPKGARKDRHENIGFGYIGFDALINIIYNKRIEDIPKILETPWVGEYPPYKEEIEMIKNKEFDPELKEKLENI